MSNVRRRKCNQFIGSGYPSFGGQLTGGSSRWQLRRTRGGKPNQFAFFAGCQKCQFMQQSSSKRSRHSQLLAVASSQTYAKVMPASGSNSSDSLFFSYQGQAPAALAKYLFSSASAPLCPR
jgi:hypothetical protein